MRNFALGFMAGALLILGIALLIGNPNEKA